MIPEPMRPEDIPPNIKAIVDKAAGREHSATGPVMACLAEVLTAHEAMVRAEVAEEILADVDHLFQGRREGGMWEAAFRASKVARGEIRQSRDVNAARTAAQAASEEDAR